jgi:hypothetical protein
MNATEYDKLVADARAQANAKIDAAKKAYGLGTYSQFAIDLPTATIRFLDEKNVEKIRSRIQAAGSWSRDSQTFLWARDNETIPDAAKNQMQQVHAFGEQHEIEHLMFSFDECDEGEAWTVTAIAAQVLNAGCLYRAPGKSTELFLLLFDIEKVA